MTDKPTLPANIKPNTLTAYVWELGQKDARMPVQDMVDAINKKFPGNTYARQTILAARSTFGIRERNAPTPSNTKGAAPKPTGKRGPYKKVRKKAAKPASKAKTNGHADTISTGHHVDPDAPPRSTIGEFRKLVSRIGTDAARKHLEEIERL